MAINQKLQHRDIRKAKWYEEVSEYFSLDVTLLQTSVSQKRIEPENEPPELKEARESIRRAHMSPEAIKLHDKILTEHPTNITDLERSTSWKEYIFVCINGERRNFQRMFFYDQLTNCIIKPMLRLKESIKVMDYGSGSSLFTRMLSQDFKSSVRTISADVCKPAVEFSVARNKLYNSNASGILIEDVLSFPKASGIDVILAYVVFEHLPNSTHQISRLIEALSPGGILIENYSGHSHDIPHKSDTFDSYRSRDRNLNLLNKKLALLYGSMPQKKNGIYDRDSKTRIWIKDSAKTELVHIIKKNLSRQNSFPFKAGRKISNFLTRL